MVRFEHTLTIGRPPSEVFAYLTDVTNLPEWQGNVVESRKEGEGPLTVGSRFVEVRKFLGKRMESQMEVTAHEQDRRFDVKVLSGPVQFQVHHRFEEADGGTRIVFTGEGEPGGFFKLAEPLVGRQAQRQAEADFGTLKDILEARG